MTSKNTALRRFLIPTLIGANLILFFAYFIPYYVAESAPESDAAVYLISYFQEIVLWLLAPISAAALILYSAENDGVTPFGFLALLTLPNLFYTIPYYYISGIENGLDSFESLLLMAAVSAVYALLFFIHTLLLFAVARRTLAKSLYSRLHGGEKGFEKKGYRALLKTASPEFSSALYPSRLFDLDSPLTLSLFFISLVEFVLRFIKEAVTAANYLISYAGDYRGEEILYMAFRFLFVFAMLFLTHLLCYAISKISLNSKPKNED